MRQSFSNKAFMISSGPTLRGVLARRRALLTINIALMIAFISTSVVAIAYSVNLEQPHIAISSYEFGNIQSMVSYDVNPAVPGWK